MKIVVDTNLLTRLAISDDAQHAEVRSAIKHLRQAGHMLCVVPQILYEYWAVCTRPHDVNGLGFPVEVAQREMALLKQLFNLLDDTPELLRLWERRVTTAQAKGKTSHDARIVAAMDQHSITDLVTYNKSHFAKFAGISLRTPNEVIAAIA